RVRRHVFEWPHPSLDRACHGQAQQARRHRESRRAIVCGQRRSGATLRVHGGARHEEDQHLRDRFRRHAARATHFIDDDRRQADFTDAHGPWAIRVRREQRRGQGIYAFSVDATSGALTAAGDPVQLDLSSPAYVAAEPSGHFLYVTQNGVFGIRGYSIDQTSGALSELETSPYGSTQVFAGAIAFHPGGGFLFTSGAGLNAFAIDASSGALTLVEGSPFSSAVGSDPSASNLTVEPRGKYLYATIFL